MAGSEADGGGGWRYGRKTLAAAAVLTIGMFSWQLWNLVESYQIVSERESGECPTRAVEAAYSAGERLDYLAHEITHGVSLWGTTVSDSLIPELGLRFNDTDVELAAALDEAAGLSVGKVRDAVIQMEIAHHPFSQQVREVVALVAAGEAIRAEELVASAEYLEKHGAFEDGLGGMWTARGQHLVDQLDQEHRNEVLSIGIALGLFALAVGAWVLFIRRIRLGRERLHREAMQRERAERELIQAQKMDALGQMAGGIAHDFNNLVTAIGGSATSVKRQLGNDHPALPGVQRIEEAATQANNMVRGLLTFSRRSDSVKGPVEIGEVMDASRRILGPTMPAVIDLIVDHPAEPLLWVDADSTQLQQVLMNLVLNARDAMPEGGSIVMKARLLEAADAASKVVIEVIDTGEGIAPDVMPHVFEPFFTTRPTGEGTGLGLSIIHGIIASHDGTVDVESVVGDGAIFRIELPAIEPPVDERSQPSPASAAMAPGGATVLLVEDHQHVREIMTETLEGAGFAVVTSDSGPRFLDLFNVDPARYDLLILDVDIPPPRGDDCVALIRDKGFTTPALVVTGMPAPGLEEELDGAAVVLRKPFTMARLVDTALSLVGAARV